jgi:hypothetical protein
MLLKNNYKAKGARGMAQVVEHLPGKVKALRRNPSTCRKKKVIKRGKVQTFLQRKANKHERILSITDH